MPEDLKIYVKQLEHIAKDAKNMPDVMAHMSKSTGTYRIIVLSEAAIRAAKLLEVVSRREISLIKRGKLFWTAK